MKNFALVFLTVLFLGWICTPIQAVQQPPYDEIETMLKKVEANLQTAGQATKLAQTMSAELIEKRWRRRQNLSRQL